MNTNEYIINKLLQNSHISTLLSNLKSAGSKCYVAGGALTCIATGKADSIEDYDIFFADLDSAVSAIRYMKEDNPHVAFVSDKAITYVKGDGTKIQFIYNEFYPEAKDIFKSFDFTINMVAYDNMEKSLTVHENFWMHNSQRFLSFNSGTLFPIISSLRLDKYKNRGYKTSRNEVIKIGLAIANLNITSWEEAKKQLGNTYGFTFADFSGVKDKPFTIEALLDCIANVVDGESMPMQETYLYPHNVVDFVLLNKPLEYMVVGGKEYWVDSYASDVSDNLDSLIETGKLSKVEVVSSEILSGDWYYVSGERLERGTVIDQNFWGVRAYRKESLYTNDQKAFIYKVKFEEKDLKDFEGDYVNVGKLEIQGLICRTNQLSSFKKGTVTFRESAKMTPHWSKNKNPNSTEERIKLIRDNIASTGGRVMYARNSFEGIILEGGESITADELLYMYDGCGVPFGGSCKVNADGTFSGVYNTD